jgi:hypothetical protein
MRRLAAAQVAAFAFAAMTVAGVGLVSAEPASPHGGGAVTTRLNAHWQVRDILRDEYGWFVYGVRCGSSTWRVGVHFPCSFTRLGREYLVCYHSIDYDYGEVTNYSRYTCHKWY